MNALYKRIFLTVGLTFLSLSFCPTAMAGNVCSGVAVTPMQTLTQPNGAIYAIANNDDLLWFGHEGLNDGTFRWTFNESKKVGNGWNVKHIFSGGDGIIYVINQNNDLMWYRHEGRNDGTFRWTFNEGKKVGNSWNFQHVFSGATLAP